MGSDALTGFFEGIAVEQPAMSEARARELVQVVKGGLNQARVALLELEEGRGWVTLGYGSWRECVTTEFGQVERTLYKQLEAAKLEREICPFGQIGEIPEGQLRPLQAVRSEPEQVRAAWNRAEEIAEEVNDGKITAAIVTEAVKEIKNPDAPASTYYKRGEGDRTPDETMRQPFDHCQTPPYAVDPLLPYIPQNSMVWEPAQGDGFIVDALFDARLEVVAGDITTGQNFFEYEPAGWDLMVTNPPYSLKYRWLERCYALGKPFALLLPVETLGAKTAQELFKEHGVQMMCFDKRVNFKMPFKGWDGSSQFPTAWFTWGLNLPSMLTFVTLKVDENEHR